jgi:uncharacterized protein (TIGR03086 family)
MHPTEQLAAIVPRLIGLVDRLDTDQLYGVTPCDQFCVHDVLDHMIVLGSAFAHQYRGEPVPEITAPVEYGWVPRKEFRAAMSDLLAAVQAPGALERTIEAPVGALPGETFARFLAFDALVHGWDIATATGQPYEVPDDVVAAVDGFAHDALTADLRDGVTFADATTPPADATPIERVAAFSGRTVTRPG